MLLTRLKLLLLFLLLANCTHTQSKDKSSVKIATWNIRFSPEFVGLGIEDEFPWSIRSKKIGKKLDLSDLAILGVQEGNKNQLDSLMLNVASMRMLESHRFWSNSFYPTFVFDESKVTIIDSGDLWLSESPDVVDSKLATSAWPRMLTWMLAKINGFEGRWLIINTHMDGSNSGQVDILSAQVGKLYREKKPDHTILLGDFNFSLSMSENQQFKFSIVDEIFERYVSNTTFNGHGKLDLTNHKWDIDWILLDQKSSQDFLVKRHIDSSEDVDRVFLSDHDMVVRNMPGDLRQKQSRV